MADSFLVSSPRSGIGSELGSSDDEYSTVTITEVLEKLEEAWLNEKFAPDLLEHKTEIVESVMLQIKETEENLLHVKKGDFVARIQKMELDRVRYVLCSYLRTRLQKIEKYVVHILEREASNSSLTESLLSPEELAYAKDYADSVDEHFDAMLLRHMPGSFKKIDRRKADHTSSFSMPSLADQILLLVASVNLARVLRPNLEEYVFMKAVKKKDRVVVDPEVAGRTAGEETVDLLPGNQYILPYYPISSLIKTGAAKLI